MERASERSSVAALEGHRREISGYTRADFAEHIRTEHSTFRWLLEPMLVAAGFEIVTAEFSRSICGAYTCRKR